MPSLRRGDKREPGWKPTGFEQASAEQQRVWGLRSPRRVCPQCGKFMGEKHRCEGRRRAT